MPIPIMIVGYGKHAPLEVITTGHHPTQPDRGIFHRGGMGEGEWRVDPMRDPLYLTSYCGILP